MKPSGPPSVGSCRTPTEGLTRSMLKIVGIIRIVRPRPHDFVDPGKDLGGQLWKGNIGSRSSLIVNLGTKVAFRRHWLVAGILRR